MLYNGEGGEKNDDQAKKLFKSAADKGNKEAQFMLGFMLYVGDAINSQSISLFDLSSCACKVATSRTSRLFSLIISCILWCIIFNI
jgi:TPR repeat protein